jgi:hypothetical protein
MARQIIKDEDIRKLSRNEDPDGTDAVSVSIIQKDGYFDRLFKYIPAELVAGYIFVLGAVKQLTDPDLRILQWSLFIVFLILTPLYLRKVQKVLKIKQLIISTISFGVWVFALGGPFAMLGWYNPVYGSLLLPVFTIVVAIWEA